MVEQAPPAASHRSRTRVVVQACCRWCWCWPSPLSAVVVYQALTWALPILIGIGCYLWWRRRSWTTTPEDAQRPAQARRPWAPAHAAGSEGEHGGRTDGL
jgi:hypothetical protein